MLSPNPVQEMPPLQVLQFRRGGVIPAHTPFFWGGDGPFPTEFPMYVQDSPVDREVTSVVWWAPVYVRYEFEVMSPSTHPPESTDLHSHLLQKKLVGVPG